MIVRALTGWRVDLLGTKFKVYTDHCTLEHFLTQKDLSRWQAHWQEFLAQYRFEIIYVWGEENTVTDALSHVEQPFVEPSITNSAVAPVFSITADTQLLKDIRMGNNSDN